MSEFRVKNRFDDLRFDPSVKRHPGDIIEVTDEARISRWIRRDLIHPAEVENREWEDWPWGQPGRDLSALEDEPHSWGRIVVCLNIWNDLKALKLGIETWYPHVDHVIAVDGAYEGTDVEVPWSTDGTVEFLRGLDKVELIETEEFWADQCLKRTQYLEAAREGDLLWKIDADEHYHNAEAIRETPYLDVGWIRYKSPIYERTQDIPNVFRYRPGMQYDGRHHWLYDGDGELVKTNQQGGKNLVHRLIPIWFENTQGEGRGPERRQNAMQYRREVQVKQEKRVGEHSPHGHEPLRILQLSTIDAGAVVYRFHTAINTTSPHESIMATGKQEYFEEPRQYDIGEDRVLLQKAVDGADVIHCHLNYHPYMQLGKRGDAPTVIHHHGTMYRNHPESNNKKDEIRAQLKFVSNPELLQYGESLNFLPNPMPVARYNRLAKGRRPSWRAEPFRIAHSPTKREYKGTEAFLAVCEELQQEGLAVEPVLIENCTIRESLEIKATCHAVFDSFWLGMQCSGLEGASMGLPVLAGDEGNASWYEENHSAVPYTFANSQSDLREQIGRLATSRGFYNREAERVYEYVAEYHDYTAVMRQYIDLLDDKFKWRRQLAVGTRNRQVTL